jgi:hypothetical protein
LNVSDRGSGTVISSQGVCDIEQTAKPGPVGPAGQPELCSRGAELLGALRPLAERLDAAWVTSCVTS